MRNNGDSSIRKTSRLNQRVLAAVQAIDHPGLLADCAGCMHDYRPTVPVAPSFFRAILNRYVGGSPSPIHWIIRSIFAAVG
jgi:hypothetical protein